RTYLSGREQMREYSSRCYYVVRLYILEGARRLAKAGKLRSPEEVFLLHARELTDLGLNTIMSDSLRKAIDYRDLMYRGYREFLPPNELGGGVAQRTEESFHERAEDGSLVLKGLGCSPGEVEGTIRIIDSLDQIDHLQRGDILVTRFTDPGWTAALGLVSGIVTEVGGVL
ncbi:Putative pyruvate phosphate dikinase, partial [Candidatus Arthromitus sp. SFB-2]